MPFYAALEEADRERIRSAIRIIVDDRATSGVVEFRTPVLLAIGIRD